MQRLGKNLQSYQGETIEIQKVLAEIEAVAREAGWEPDPLQLTENSPLPAFRRTVAAPRQQIYISSGIHGDEPAGPLAVLQLVQDNQWPADASVWIVPCLNPGGFMLNRRENETAIDLNRDYRSIKTELVRAHINWLNRQPRFDFCLCLHEDWEAHGFYLYELNPDLQHSCAEAMIRKVKDVCPIDISPVIEGREAQNGIICANPDLMKRPDWPEAFHLIHHKTRVSYTLEAPSDFPLTTRVDALVAGVMAACEAQPA